MVEVNGVEVRIRPSEYLVDDEALDVSRLTGIPWWWARVHQRGALHPFLDIGCLDWWDKWKVLMARIGVHHYLSCICRAPSGTIRA